MFTDIGLDDDKFLRVPIDYQALLTGEPVLDGKQSYLLSKHKDLLEAPFDFSYAYAITTHKSQGSEWDKVLIFEEWFPNIPEEHKKWLYTAITRASEKVVIIKK